MQTGNLLKMKSTLGDDGLVTYQLPLDGQLVDMNPLVGRKLSLEWQGKIFCLDTQVPIKKSYGQGYSYEAFMRLAACDMCIVKPELCHYAKGTCREPSWGETHCLQPHIVYLSLTSGMKIGITRKKQIPTRWIDQGAVKALAILEVKDRLTAGLIEKEISATMADRTQWSKMLKGEVEEVDLEEKRDAIYQDFGHLIDDLGAQDLSDPVVCLKYPILGLPAKMPSIDFEKKPRIEGTLMGIKGQYLIFDVGVINIRKYQGYQVSLDVI